MRHSLLFAEEKSPPTPVTLSVLILLKPRCW